MAFQRLTTALQKRSFLTYPFRALRPVGLATAIVASMGYQEKWFRVVEQKRSGLFGTGRQSTYELLGDDRRFTTLELLAELLGPTPMRGGMRTSALTAPRASSRTGGVSGWGIPPVQGGPIRWPLMWRP